MSPPFAPLGSTEGEITQTSFGQGNPFTGDLSSFEVSQGEVQGPISSLASSFDKPYINKPDVKSMEESIGFMPYLISTLAALNGNFGPAFQIQEQKRKTGIFKAMMPKLNQIDQMSKNGQWEEALAVANETFAQFGSRAPEIAQYVDSIRKKLDADFRGFKELENFVKIIEPNVKKESPNYGILQSMKAAAQAKTPFSMSTLSSLFSSLKLDTRTSDTDTTFASPYTGETIRVAQPDIFGTRDISGYAGKKLSEIYKMAPNDLVNIVNGLPVYDESGKNITTPELSVRVKQDLSILKGVEADLMVGAQVPLEPVLSTQMLETHEPLDIATRQLGRTGTTDALTRHYDRLQKQKESEIRAGLELDPFIASSRGLTVIDKDYTSPTFLREVPVAAYRDVQSIPKFGYIDKELYRERVQPTAIAINGLDYVNQLYRERNDPTSTYDRLSTGLRKIISDYTGLSFSSSDTLAKVSEAIVKRSIEQVEKTQTIKDSTIGELKGFITGGFADAESAKKGVFELQNRLRYELGVFIGQQSPKESQHSPPSGRIRGKGLKLAPINE